MSYAVGDGRKILHLLDFFPSGSKNWEVGTSAQRTEGLTDERKGLYCLHELAVQITAEKKRDKFLLSWGK